MKNRIGKIRTWCLGGVALAIVSATLPSLAYANAVQNSNGVPTCSATSTAKFGGSNYLQGTYQFPADVATVPGGMGNAWIKGTLTLKMTRGPLYSKALGAVGYNLTPKLAGCVPGKSCVLYCGYGYSKTVVGDNNMTPYNLIAWAERYPFTMPLK